MTPSAALPPRSSDAMSGLTAVALVVLLAGVAARVTVNELASETFTLTEGADLGGPGPTTTILLNALCVLPALLVLVRRAIDPNYVLRWHVSQVLVFVLAAWITLSAAWASNKFDALLGASTWWTAAAVLWAAGQLCRSWTRLRPVLGVAAGLMMIFVAQSLIYRFYEGPELLHYWETDPEIVARRQAEPESFAIRQMDRTVHNGTQQAFFRSPNTFAAVGVLAALVTAGFVGQQWLAARKAAAADAISFTPHPLGHAPPGLRREAETSDVPIVIILGLPLLGLPAILFWTGSRTAGAVAILATIALLAAWSVRDVLARQSRRAYAVGAAVFLVGVAGVVAIGLKTGGLLHDSLTFRWHYWVASWRLLRAHPWTGVGWTNFGPHYLAYRLPVAAEEIKNPHNLFVTFAAETGVIGLVLAAAWLARTLWELTRPATPRGTSAVAGRPWLGTALGIAALFWLLRLSVLWPLTVTPSELIKTALFGLLLLVGLLLSVVRHVKDPTPDDRPAPFLVYATVVGLLAFLLHNLVDFSIFETGPLLLFVLTLGGVLGVRHPGVAGRRTHTAAAVGGLAATFVALLAAAGLWAAPVMIAESKAAAAEDKGRAAADAARTGRPDFASGLRRDAVESYREAIAATPVRNPDYAVRATRYMDDAAPNDVLAMLSTAVESDPADVQRYLQRARFGRSVKAPSVTYLADYEQFVTRNPNDALIRIEYAEALAEVGQAERAKTQYRAALEANAGLNPDEPRRLPETRMRDVEARLR